MPDTEDYEYLGRLLDHPEKWGEDDLSAVRDMIVNQRRAFEGLHPEDIKGQRSQRELIDRLESAVRSYLARARGSM